MQSKDISSPQQLTGLTAALGLLLLLFLALTQFSSHGVMRGGDDHEGSGIGGNGLKPYLGSNAANEIEILRDPAQYDTAIIKQQLQWEFEPKPIPPIVPSVGRVSRNVEKTRDSAPIDISEAIQIELDVNALLLEQLRQEVITATQLEQVTPGNAYMLAPDLAIQHAPQLSWDEIDILLQGSTEPNTDKAAGIGSSTLASAEYDSEDAVRLARPEFVQRPQLPPPQRFSPLQRTAILPPRVQPLRL